MPTEALLQFAFRSQAPGPEQTVAVGGSKSPESASELYEHEIPHVISHHLKISRPLLLICD